MNRRRFLQLALLATSFGTFADRVKAATAGGIEVSTRAADLVRENLVVDLLGLLTLDWAKLFRWQNAPDSFRVDDVRRLASSGINVFHPAVAPRESDQRVAAAIWIDGWNRLIRSHACHLMRIDDLTGLLVVPRVGRIGVVLGFQNSSHFHSVEDVGFFFRHGQRISGLTYNGRNRLGSGCKVARDRGLTTFGAEVVAEMNRLGMAVDLSHCGTRTSLDAIEASDAPTLITHSNCQRLVPWQARNKSDEVIRRMARQGGVMGITTVRAFVGGGNPSFDDWLDHFDHVARLVGPEYVALGSDIDVDAVDAAGRPIPQYVIRGLCPGARAFQLAEGLLRRGYNEDDVRGVLGGNVLRVLSTVWPQEIRNQQMRRDPFCPVLPPATPEGMEIHPG